MRRITVVITILVLSALACSRTISTPVPTTPTPTPRSVVPTLTTVPTTLEWTAEVRLPTVNVRACAGCDEVLRTLRAGDAVTLVRCVYTPELGDWCQIKPRGWIYRGCLSINSGLGCSSN
jgi:hypothetical protein